MVWSCKSPESGDMIRVKSGSIYHYGVFVSEEEVLQFGLAPASRPQLRDCDVSVCSSNVDAFLCGGDLEVGALDKKEQEKRRAPYETVRIARKRLGEKGYNILYNNCEHFAYECLFGEHYCSQTERVRELFHNFPVLDVYVAEIPQDTPLSTVYPPARDEEIKACGSQKVQREKYYAWKLLEYAAERTFGKKLKKIDFSKTENGKWECKEFAFSLSHSKNAVAVALSRKPVGVDIELFTPVKEGAAEKILSAAEKTEYEALSNKEREEYLLKKWTQKESIFKRGNEVHFIPAHTETQNEPLRTEQVALAGDTYFLSVASEHIQRFRLHKNIELSKL